MDTDEEPSGVSLSSETETCCIEAGALCIVVGIIGSSIFFVSRRINFSLNHLTRSANAIEKGKLNEPVPNLGIDEFGDLASAFDSMRISLKQNEEEIHQLNQTLEQRVIERTKELEAVNKELEAFSYSVSHDLRAPLRSIDGFSQILLEKYQDKPLDDKGKTYLDRVRRATQRMGRLIDDMLKLSRITRAEFKRRNVNISNMIRAIAEEHHKSNPERLVDIAVQEGIMVQGDPNLMQIAMENLMGNAWKFTGKEAHPKIEFGTTVRDGETACFIRDNGAGFDMAYAGKLFGAFQRLHTTDEFPGTGIGLATVQRIIHRHGGKVWAEGEKGKGAVFYFTLT